MSEKTVHSHNVVIVVCVKATKSELSIEKCTVPIVKDKKTVITGSIIFHAYVGGFLPKC